jgi:hypothetical protein
MPLGIENRCAVTITSLFVDDHSFPPHRSLRPSFLATTRIYGGTAVAPSGFSRTTHPLTRPRQHRHGLHGTTSLFFPIPLTLRT